MISTFSAYDACCLAFVRKCGGDAMNRYNKLKKREAI